MDAPKLQFKTVEIYLIGSFDIVGQVFLKGTVDNIGAFEGRLANGCLFSVLHLQEPYQKKGIGFEIMQGILAYYKENQQEVRCLVGSWHRHEEFRYLPGGQSINLTVFKEQLNLGGTKEKAALDTPTGKWAQQLGFNKATILKHSEDDVTVYFCKE